ncbi:CDP-alcohol phosphatidyltransferase family protein [Advenella sp. WQ 585]|uniref:CDP-alcohol phosphatidyltransferase family protein n=1 Tax=Advenella mandrilli TaxID=2800330 RepID=A0ABS1E9J4_9BURK|nr:CDP-alcohol phosphatidyltransferase family protein [Advenella mandrilli]MBK1780424.1 CDP-alcohol phosphatidyltransferase family protein [Advenella mandrilli]
MDKKTSPQTEAAVENRRPIASRKNRLVIGFVSFLARQSFPTPNQISCISILFAAIGALALLFLPGIYGLVVCAVGIQLRLICNLLDGMVALEGGKKTATGEIFNEFPDRIADTLLIVALGYAINMAWLGWLGALLAALTAYIRVFGGSLGLPQSFRGPMAKQHRMAVLTAACLLGAIEYHLWSTQYCLILASVVIAAGSLITCYTRTKDIATKLENRRSQA